MIILGTSGYSFRDWVGPFYPPGIPQGQMLNYYVGHFSAVEINSTYYRMPHPKVMTQIERKTPEGFHFTVKLPGDVTHRQTRDPAVFEEFLRVIAPLEEAGKFRGALAQFPWSFRDSRENWAYLAFLRQAFPERPLFAEFRQDSWAREETFEGLRSLGLGFCSADEPKLRGLFPPLARVVGETAYVRLHGRNAKDWWGGDNSGRYNYLYNDDELKEWAQKIRELAAQSANTFVFFNNCHAGRAVQNAKRMAELLELDL
jgi:uncharacterized protein YecE (DUF72 family)